MKVIVRVRKETWTRIGAKTVVTDREWEAVLEVVGQGDAKAVATRMAQEHGAEVRVHKGEVIVRAA